MSYWLNVTNQARDDITRNATWWADRHSLEEALKWYDAIYEQLDTLLPFPESHSLSVENDAFSYELREILVGGKKRTSRAIFTIRWVGGSRLDRSTCFATSGDAG